MSGEDWPGPGGGTEISSRGAHTQRCIVSPLRAAARPRFWASSDYSELLSAPLCGFRAGFCSALLCLPRWALLALQSRAATGASCQPWAGSLCWEEGRAQPWRLDWGRRRKSRITSGETPVSSAARTVPAAELCPQHEGFPWGSTWQAAWPPLLAGCWGAAHHRGLQRRGDCSPWLRSGRRGK